MDVEGAGDDRVFGPAYDVEKIVPVEISDVPDVTSKPGDLSRSSRQKKGIRAARYPSKTPERYMHRKQIELTGNRQMGEPFHRERPKKDFPQDYAAHDIIGYLLDNAAELSKAHGKIADAILHHPTTFVEKPIEDLVTWLGVSAPTITRFSRTIGCDGLRDLKLKVMSSLRVGMRYLEPLTPPGTLAEVQERVVLRAQRAVLAAQKTIDVVMLDRVIDALTQSRMIYAFGSGGVSSWMVDEVHNRLFRLGLRITSSSDHQMQMMLAATVERGDVVFCSSLSGNNAELIKAVRIAADYGATTIALTVRDTPLVRAVALPLALDIADDGDVLGPTCLRYAFLAAVDMLAYGAAIRSSRAQEKLRRIKQQYTTFRDTDDTQPVSD